jgi:hypothetical protein
MKDYKDIGIQFNYSDEQIKFFLQSGISQDVGKKMGGNAIIFCCSKKFQNVCKKIYENGTPHTKISLQRTNNLSFVFLGDSRPSTNLAHAPCAQRHPGVSPGADDAQRNLPAQRSPRERVKKRWQDANQRKTDAERPAASRQPRSGTGRL